VRPSPPHRRGLSRSRRPRGLLLLVLGAGLAAGGWIGSATSRATPPSAPAAVTSTLSLPSSAPFRSWTGRVSPCLAAVEQADAVISYLVGGVRDARLESALQRYVATAHGCRKEQS
jgi:hypothetical protein